MKSFKCTDGFVTKTISAATAQDAAESYAIVTSEVTVTEVDGDGKDVSEATVISVTI